MDDLPLVPAIKIIDYLSTEDILNLKLVNKWFYQIINENVKIKDLVISDQNDLPYNRICFYTCDQIRLQHLIKCNSNNNVYFNLNRPAILSQFKHLKQLYIYKSNVTLETLNSLDGLVHLEIKYSKIKSLARKKELSLPMLEILNLDATKFYFAPVIDSVKLQRLRLINFVVKLVHPESITHLEVDDFNNCEFFLSSCINLQHFYCYYSKRYMFLEINMVKNFPNLKSIHLDESKDEFVSLVNEKKRLKKDLKIYFHNLEFDEVPTRSFSNGKFLDLILSKSYAENYSRLADCCPFIESAYYNWLEKFFVQIPEKFMDRFVNLTSFIVDEKIKDFDQLIRVLRECRTITCLRLPSSLGQNFFDFHFYDLCPNIVTLDITSDEVLNCEFILKFKNIHELYVKQTLTVELVKKLIESLKIMTFRFNFYYQDLFEIRITNYRDRAYELAISKPIQRLNKPYSLVLKSLDDLDKLESYCDDSKSELL